MTNEIIGKKILVGLTYFNHDNEIEEKTQLYGNIKEVSDNTLVFTQLNDLGDFSIPFTGDLEPTDEDNVFVLKSTGEEVTGVNFIASFNIRMPPDE